jgi:hypothetical protein
VLFTDCCCILLLLLLHFVAPAAAAAANPEEIELGDEDDADEDMGGEGGEGGDGGEGEGEEGGDVQEKVVPAAVFGSLAGQKQQAGEEPVGALERFKKRRVD